MSRSKEQSIEELRRIVANSTNQELAQYLKGTGSAKYFTFENAKTASSILSVLLANIKPLRFLFDIDSNENFKKGNNSNSFSIEEYLENLEDGKNPWLFLAAEPSTRELTIPIISALAELIISRLMNLHSQRKSQLWFVIDELAALGRFPSLPKLMQESRKYKVCVLSALQSTSQLFAHYGAGDGNNLFALFKTKFAFQSDDPHMGNLYSSICGNETITRQQKNTSFGANTFRDGISYSEQQQEKPLLKLDDFAKLKTGECYVFLPEPRVRLSLLEVPEASLKDSCQGFIESPYIDAKIESAIFLTSNRKKSKTTCSTKEASADQIYISTKPNPEADINKNLKKDRRKRKNMDELKQLKQNISKKKIDQDIADAKELDDIG